MGIVMWIADLVEYSSDFSFSAVSLNYLFYVNTQYDSHKSDVIILITVVFADYLARIPHRAQQDDKWNIALGH
jgi:hypothetical protein